MTVWMKWTLAGLVLAGVALTVAIVVGTWRQRRITAEMVDGLLRQPHSYTAGTRVTFDSLDQLPPPVARYFQRAGMRVPTEAEVGWYVAGTWSPVWRGTMTTVNYEFAP